MADQQQEPTTKKRGPTERMNLTLSKAAAALIKQKTRLYPGQQSDFISRLALRYEEEHLAGDLAAVVEEKERERRVALGLEGIAELPIPRYVNKDEPPALPEVVTIEQPDTGFIDPGVEGEPPPRTDIRFPGFAR